MISRWRVVVMAAVLAWPVAAGAAHRDEDDRKSQVVEGPKQLKTFNVGPTGSLKLGNVAGDVTVTGGNGGEIRIEAMPHGKGKTEAEAQQQLDTVTVETRQSGNRVDVETKHKPNSHAWVDYTVIVPMGASLDVRTVSGDVRVTNVNGSVIAETVSGDVQAMSLAQVSSLKAVSGDVTGQNLASDGNVSLGTVSGDVVIKNLKAKSVSVETVSGDARLEQCECGGVTSASVSGDVVYVGSLASGARYAFSTHSGDVLLTTPSGFELNATTFSGDLRADGLAPQGGSERMGRTARGTVGGGGAVVEVKTFSGDFRATRR
jgi:DUF4097 and DUF4098 domain-containing protein YvlB